MATKTLRMIYYLSRDGQLEEPHLLEVPVTASNSRALRLIDVKEWLMLTRGKNMPASFSWSYRRNYKEGCIWQDVSADEDLILPASEGEYVLKGSKFVVASKELWPASLFAKLDQASPGMHNEFNCTVPVNEDITRANERGTAGLLPGNEQDVHDAEDLCQVSCSGAVGKFDIMWDQNHHLVDTRSSCVMAKNQPLPTSNLSILEPRLVHNCHSRKEQGETKSFGNPGNRTQAALDASCPTSPTGLLLEAKQEKSATTAGDQMDRQVLELNVAENARLLQTDIKHQTTGNDCRDKQVSDLKVAAATAILLQSSNKCEAPCNAIDGVDVALVSRNLKSVPSKTTDIKTKGNKTLVESKAVPCTLVESTLQDQQPPKYAKSKGVQERASCKAMDVNIPEIEDEPSKHPNKVVAKRRRIRTKWGCRYTPVSLSHLNVGDMSACKPRLPLTEGIGGEMPLHDKKVSNKRVSYSDKLGVKLPAMVLKDVAVHDFEPLCPFHQRLATMKGAPISSSHTPTYRHKTPASQYLPKKTTLPVFGAEKRQQQLIEELDLFRIELGTSDINIISKSNQSQFSCMQRASKISAHEYRWPDNAVEHDHSHTNLSRRVSRKGSKILWEELLQTTKDAITRQETM